MPLPTLETILTELGRLIWKWGLFLVILMCTVASRLFYEMIYNPEVKLRRLLAIGGLGTSVGVFTIVWVSFTSFSKPTSIILIGLSILISYRFIEYVVKADIETVKTWIKGILTNAIDSLGKGKPDGNK